MPAGALGHLRRILALDAFLVIEATSEASLDTAHAAEDKVGGSSGLLGWKELAGRNCALIRF